MKTKLLKYSKWWVEYDYPFGIVYTHLQYIGIITWCCLTVEGMKPSSILLQWPTTELGSSVVTRTFTGAYSTWHSKRLPQRQNPHQNELKEKYVTSLQLCEAYNDSISLKIFQTCAKYHGDNGNDVNSDIGLMYTGLWEGVRIETQKLDIGQHQSL